MILFHFKTFDNSKGTVEWKIGEELPLPPSNSVKLFAAEANGRELQRIRDCFTNIPMTKGTSVAWEEVHAFFIYSNIIGCEGPPRPNLLGVTV